MGARSTGNHPTTTKADGHLLEYLRQTFSAGGGGTNFEPPPDQGLTATGGNITDYDDGGTKYRAHVFASSGTFEVSAVGDFPDAVEYLVVAGGGGGGGSNAGAGGAGGLRTNVPGVQTAGGTPLTGAAFPAPATGGNGSGVYTVTVGAAGGSSRGSGPAPQRRDGNDGNDSYFGPPSTPNGITSNGGGGGGSCALDVPCNLKYVDIFGFISIPVMASTGFLTIFLALLYYDLSRKEIVE